MPRTPELFGRRKQALGLFVAKGVDAGELHRDPQGLAKDEAQGLAVIAEFSLEGRQGILQRLGFLQPLLQSLPALRDLDLFSCPVTSEADYRKAVFEMLPELKYLDGSDRNEKEKDDDDDDDDDDDEEDEGDDDLLSSEGVDGEEDFDDGEDGEDDGEDGDGDLGEDGAEGDEGGDAGEDDGEDGEEDFDDGEEGVPEGDEEDEEEDEDEEAPAAQTSKRQRR